MLSRKRFIKSSNFISAVLAISSHPYFLPFIDRSEVSIWALSFGLLLQCLSVLSSCPLYEAILDLLEGILRYAGDEQHPKEGLDNKTPGILLGWERLIYSRHTRSLRTKIWRTGGLVVSIGCKSPETSVWGSPGPSFDFSSQGSTSDRNPRVLELDSRQYRATWKLSKSSRR